MISNKVEARSKQLAEKWTEQAAEAVKTADVAALRAVLDDAINHNTQMSNALDALVGLYANKDQMPRNAGAESESAIAAMRDVALAAVELSKSVIQTRLLRYQVTKPNSVSFKPNSVTRPPSQAGERHET